MAEVPPEVSVVLPVHDQADHIAGVVDDVVDALAGSVPPHEVLLVPNGCRDDSAAVCERLAERHAVVASHPLDRGGWGRAVRHGLTAAGGDLLCYTNSARTDPDDLRRALVYASALPEPVVVKANRKIREGVVRRAGSLLYNLECRALFDLSAWDVNGTPKVFPRSFDRLLRLTRDDDLIDTEFALACRDEGYPMIELPLFSTRRAGGRSTTGWRTALRLYRGALELERARR
ncbi:MAG: glycosyltransferase [Acidimicrobiales bacterium]|nr:glycosyltransferase [Acidimicrobiales bacterium]MCB1016704.1 glycosyltransferase [Acidimicrobiales bacterium]